MGVGAAGGVGRGSTVIGPCTGGGGRKVSSAQSIASAADASARWELVILLIRLAATFLSALWRALPFTSSRSSLLKSLSGKDMVSAEFLALATQHQKLSDR